MLMHWSYHSLALSHRFTWSLMPIIDCGCYLFQLLGLYKGITSPLYGLAAINCIVFGVQGNVQRRLNNPDNISSHFVAGSVAGLSQTVICSPMELAKTRMQIQGQGESRSKFRTTRHTYDGPVDCMRQIFRTEGVRGVFRGFWVTAIRETPSFGLYFASYEVSCRFLQGDAEECPTWVMLVGGGFAGMCSWLSTYPMDVIKSRLQADMSGKYDGFMDCVRKSYHEEGMRAFGKGLCSTMLRAFPVNAATFATVEWVMRLGMRNEDDSAYVVPTLPQPVPSVTHQHTVHMHVVPNFPSHPWGWRQWNSLSRHSERYPETANSLSKSLFIP